MRHKIQCMEKRNIIKVIIIENIISFMIIITMSFISFGNIYTALWSLLHIGLIGSLYYAVTLNANGFIMFIIPVIILIISIILFIRKQTDTRITILGISILLYYLNLYVSSVSIMGI
jgi:hypothetical protein